MCVKKGRESRRERKKNTSRIFDDFGESRFNADLNLIVHSHEARLRSDWIGLDREKNEMNVVFIRECKVSIGFVVLRQRSREEKRVSEDNAKARK